MKKERKTSENRLKNCEISTCKFSIVTMVARGGGLMTTNGDFWGLMGTKNHGDSG